MFFWVVFNACSRNHHMLEFETTDFWRQRDVHELSAEKSPFQAELKHEKLLSGRQDGPLLLDWGNRRIQRIRWIFTAWSVWSKCAFRYMRAPSTFRDINAFVWKLQVGGCLIKKTIQWEGKKMSGSGSWGLHKWWETESFLFSDDFMVDISVAVDVSLPVLAKVSVLIEALRLSGSYELVHQLWSHFTLVVGRVNVDVICSLNEVLASALLVPCFTLSFRLPTVGSFLLIQSKQHVPLSWARSSLELRIVATVALSLKSGASTSGSSVLGQQPVSSGPCDHFELFQQQFGRAIAALGPNVRVVLMHGGPHAPVEAFVSYLDSGYQEKLIEKWFFKLCWFEGCLKRIASSVFGSLDPHSMEEFLVNRPKGADGGDWTASRPGPKKAIVTSSLVMKVLLEIEINNLAIWPLIFLYLKKNMRNRWWR